MTIQDGLIFAKEYGNSYATLDRTRIAPFIRGCQNGDLMKRQLLNLLLAFTATAFNTNAAIINADTNNYNAFKDTDTGLVWLDFGENNQQSYNYVVSQLGLGGEWEGWRLPTGSEVYLMWSNVADLGNVAADFENPDNYGPGQLYAFDQNNGATNSLNSV